VKVVLGPFTGIVQRGRFGNTASSQAVDFEGAYCDAVRIDIVVFIRPGAPTVSHIGYLVSNIANGVAPVHYNTGIVILDKSHVSITTLLVGHMLTAADDIAAAALGTLIGNPLAVLRDEIHVVIGASPEDHLIWIAVKVDDYVRMVANPPHVVPLRIELQPAVGCPELAGTLGQLGQLSPFKCRSGLWSVLSI